MKKAINKPIKIKSINYYLFLSILIHLFLFIVSSEEREIALGDKLIPVEIININSIISKGDYLIKPEKQITKAKQSDTPKEKFLVKKTQEKVLTEDKENNILAVKKVFKKKRISAPSSEAKINRNVGNEGKETTNKVEKGSLKGKGIEKITCLSCVKPKYPKLALRGGYEGIVKLKILIAKNGKVIDVKILKSSGYDILDKTGIKAALNSKFYPLTQKRTINIEYNLKLN